MSRWRQMPQTARVAAGSAVRNQHPAEEQLLVDHHLWAPSVRSRAGEQFAGGDYDKDFGLLGGDSIWG